MVKPGRLVAGKVLGIGGAVVAVLAIAYIFRKSQAGTATLASLQGAGKFGGQALLAPIEGLISGVAAGVGSLTQQGAKIGANLASFSEAIAAGDFQSIIDGSFVQKYGAPGDQSKQKTSGTSETGKDFTPTVIIGGTDIGRDNTSISSREQRTPQPIAQLDLGKILSDAAILRRIETTRKAAVIKPNEAFGGFGSAEAQETALQKAIRESAAKFPQFFKNTTTVSGQFTQKLDAFGRPIRSF